jgi:hypothetical protein
MKKVLLAFMLAILLTASAHAQIISQYIETNIGTTPKGIEIWNNTASELDFSDYNLVIEQGTNGALPAMLHTISSGTLAVGAVIVIGTSDMEATVTGNGGSFSLKAVMFNGDDALVVKYGGDVTDVFGTPGSDPGTAWSGGTPTVSTANQNISLKSGITTGDTDGWSDPSERFEYTALGNVLTGFGIAPASAGSPEITISSTSLSGFSYDVGNGPSSSQFVEFSGASLTNDITVTPSANYEIAGDDATFHSTPLVYAQIGGTKLASNLYIRLKAGLPIETYNGEVVTFSSTGAASKTVTCSGYVEGKQTSTLPYTNDFTSGFGKINRYDAGGIRYWGVTSGAAVINGFPNDDAVDVDWMILPSVDFSAYSDVELYFETWWRYGNQNANNYLKVLYSTNYAGFGNPAGATWTEIPFTVPATEQTWTEIGPLDLSEISAADVHIAFKYQSDDAARQWYIDNINLQIYTPPPTILANAWINEIHYDNSGVDVDESIEVAVERADTLNLAEITVTLYNGGDGVPYNTKTLDQFTQGATVGDYTFFYYNYTANAQSIQNGPDGIALDWKGNLIQFLSYGGTFNGVGGPANATASTNINVIETGTTLVGYSLQLVGTGLNYGHFIWIDPPANFGNMNNNQLLAPPPPPVPVDWRYILMAFVLIAGITVYRKLR